MKAVYIAEQGGVEVLTYGAVPEPEIGPYDVKIRVRACALNRLDVYTRAGVRGTRRTLSEPHILGSDVSGEVDDVGSAVRQVKPGDRVVANPVKTCGQCRFCIGGTEELCVKPEMLGSTTNGGYAEYVIVPAVNCIVLPESVSYEQAAALPTVFLPCWSILIRRAALQPWETVLVPSASSGVGTAAIQVAKNVIGARVIATTSSAQKVQLARELGADDVINYTEEDVAERIRELTGRGVDVVIDHVGADVWPAAIASLNPGGRYGICGVTSGYKTDLQMGLMFLRHQTVFGVFMGRTEDLRQIVEMAGKGVIRGVVHKTFTLEESAQAHALMESRDFFGKLVLTVP